MKKLFITLISFLTFSSAFALNTEAVYEAIYEIDASYFYGDDGVDCNTELRLTNLKMSRFNDSIEVHYSVDQDYSIYGCQEPVITCRVLLRSKDFAVLEDTMECDDWYL